MAEDYKFFDSIDGEDERLYTADEFAEYFRQFIRNGIFSGGQNLKVSTDEKDMKIKIKPGYAWIEGYLYKISGEDLILEHNISDPSLNRIDRVVIRLDKTLENRYVKAFILEGTPATTPKAPELTRDDNIYEISLAKIEIIAGKSFIEEYQITDERLDNLVCGITTHLFEQVDTTAIFHEWENYLVHKRNESNLSYEEFVAAYQNTWNSWIEEKISEPGGEFYSEWKYWFNELQDTTNLVTKTHFDNHKNDESNPHKVNKEQVGLGNVDNVKQIALSEKGNANGITPLDDEGEVPSIHLGNLPYVDEYYSRVPTIFDFGSINNLYHYGLDNQIEIDLVASRAFREVQTSAPYYNSVSISDETVSINAWSDTGIGYAIAATDKIDLTNIQTIEVTWEYSGSNYPNNETYLGISKNNTSSYSSYDTRLMNRGTFALRTQTLNVSSYNGEYYIKASGVDVNTSKDNHVFLKIHSVVLKSNTKDFTHNRNDNSISLKSGKYTGELKLPQIEMAPNGLSWHNINLMGSTPNGSSIKVDIYNENESILKNDLESGSRFKRFTENILKPRIKFERDSTGINPSLRWISFNQITSGNSMWEYLGKINLTVNTLQIEIDNLPSFDEYLITGVILYTSQSDSYSSNLTPYINGATTNDIEYITTNLRGSTAHTGNAGNSRTNINFSTSSYNSSFELLISKAYDSGWLMKFSEAKGRYYSASSAKTNKIGNLNKLVLNTDSRTNFKIGTKLEIYGRNYK